MNPGQALLPVSNSVMLADYTSIMDKLIAFTPHEVDIYSEENAKLLYILKYMVSGTSYEFSIKSYQQNRDRQSAYLDLWEQNIGSSKWDKILEDAEAYVNKRD